MGSTVPKKEYNMKKLVFITSGILFTIILILRLGFYIQYDRYVDSYLKRAADANTVERAKEELSTALENIRDLNLDCKPDTCYTSIFFTTPDEDIGFWYHNILDSYHELKKLDPEATHLEKSNTLIKLRETLLDNDKNGTKVTSPPGISVYPSNKSFFMFQIILFLLVVVSLGSWIYEKW